MKLLDLARFHKSKHKYAGKKVSRDQIDDYLEEIAPIPTSKKIRNTGLVIEGGGMRGLFTAGVLDYFLQNKFSIPYVIGVSAGASMGASYISQQFKRNTLVNINYANDKRYQSLRNLITQKSLFGMKFLFDKLPNELVPFDYETFFNNSQKYIIGATDCHTGKAVYFDKDMLDKQELMKAMAASCSLPFLSPIIEFKGKKLLDGGLADSIPIAKSISDGNKKNIVILTRNLNYHKSAFKFKRIANFFYKKYPNITKALLQRHQIYNDTLDKLTQMKKNGEVFIIRPQNKLTVGRLEKDPIKLTKLYKEGFSVAQKIYPQLQEWL